jgi:hypothetical protein
LLHEGELAHLRHLECLAQPGGLGVDAPGAARLTQQGTQLGRGERGGLGGRGRGGQDGAGLGPGDAALGRGEGGQEPVRAENLVQVMRPGGTR